MNTPTYEQIDAAFASIDVAKHNAALSRFTLQAVAASPSSVIGTICPIYKGVRPFLQAAANLPLLPQAWRAGISALISGMDLLCP